MTPDIAQDLAHWLEAATQGLPAAARAVVRAEIEAHYADAVGDHRASGKAEEEAHRAAMADLGDVRATARALRDTHLARQRYLKAMAVSLAAIATFMLMPTLYSVVKSEMLVSIIIRVSLLLSTLYTLFSLKVLLRLDGRWLDRPISLVVWSILAADGARILFWILFGQPAITETGDRSFWAAAPLFPKALDGVALGGEFATGAGLLLLGLGLTQVKHPLYGLRIPLQYLMLVMGCLEVGFIAAIVFEASVAAALLGSLGLLTIVLAFALLTLIFFRAVYRRSAPPLRIV
jgi:hypothetical protein